MKIRVGIRKLVSVSVVAGAAIFWGGFGPSGKAAGRTILIRDVPHVRQKPDFCGEACVAMYLWKLGHPATQDAIFNAADVAPELGRGCTARDIKAALKRIGFEPGQVWYKIEPGKSREQLQSRFDGMLAEIEQGTPSIVCMRYGPGADTPEHFRLVLGYDGRKDEVIYHEPAERHGAYCRMRRAAFLDLWPLKYGKDRWLAIRMSLKAGRLSVPKSPPGFTDADYAQHIMKLRPKIPAGFTMVLQRPFVVIGDESPAMVRYRAEKTVKWFTDRIRRLYFTKDPPRIYDIWLFKDDKSYRKHALELFGDRPRTPFGYCSAEHGALVMNIGTGGGTLCHEIVHAFIASNFPECPAWFNEGLASLYEQCAYQGGRVVGLTNWRLKGLKSQIQADSLPSFKELLSTTSYQFYHVQKGNNYAQARYLCYYLQEKGLLRKFYQAFTQDAEDDPTGFETLKGVLNEHEMDDFKVRWQKWVLKLRFP